MMRQWASAVLLSLVALPAFADDAPVAPPVDFKAGTTTSAEAGFLGTTKVTLPQGAVNGTVFLFSDGDGWGADEDSLTKAIQAAGGIVVAVDTTKMFATLEQNKTDDCIYLVSDIEELSHQIQRSLGTPNYHSPIIAGVGTAATLGLAIAAQTPDATMGHTISVDPTLVLPLFKPLCTDAPHTVAATGLVYGLATGDLTNPVDVLYTPTAPADARAHVATLQGEGFGIKTKDVASGAYAALQSRLERLLAPKSTDDNPLADLPLVELPTPTNHGAMAIIYSGDGGWRDLDKSIGDVFQKQGVPTIGVDSLRYFWSKKTPDQTAKDLTRIIDHYTEAWGIDHVILVGYSFGADVLPSAYNLLPTDEQSQVSLISLLGLSDQVDYEISVGAFLGTNSGDGATLPDLQKIKPSLIQCVYGEEEDDSACLKLQGTGAELLKTTGGHHFDGDYDALAGKILDGLQRRVSLPGFPLAEK